MRKSRFKLRRNRRNHHYFLLLLFIIIIPIVAIFIGSKITERVVMPVLFSGTTLDDGDLDDILNEEIVYTNEAEPDIHDPLMEEDAEEDKRLVEAETAGSIKTLPISVYMIQVASVSETTNMEAFIAELNERQFPHLIYKMDNSYKVYTLGLTKRELTETQLTKTREFYPDAYISEIQLPPKEIAYSKGEEELVESIVKDLNSLIELMDKQAEEWYNFIDREGGLQHYRELLKEHQKILDDLSKKIDNEALPKDLPPKEMIEKMAHHQESNIKRSQEFIEDEENRYRVHSLFLDSLFRTLEIIK